MDNEMDSHDIAGWVERVLGGDREAFGSLVKRYERLVYGLAYRRVRDRGLAEDVAQESFVRAYRMLDRLKDRSLFGNWLCGITVNVARETMRRRGMREVPLAEAGETAAMEPEARDTEEEARVMTMAEQLPEKYRIPLLMFYVGEMRYGEIGEALGMPETTARSLVHRARGMVAERFFRDRG